MASAFDLASLADVKIWLGISGGDDDVLLARLIAQTSRAILGILDRPAILPSIYREIYDDGDDASILLRQWPVNAILSCDVNGESLPPSAPLADGTSQAGFIFDPPDAAPPGRMQKISLRRKGFACGRQNVAISYSAGYQVTAENALVPPSPPYTVSARAPYGDWAGDGGVAYVDGAPLGCAAASPEPGRYAISNGVYTFAAADAGALVHLTYGYVPADLAACCMDWAAERYAYRSRIGQQSKSLGGQETMAFLVKDVPDFVIRLLQPYRRVVTP
jgi:hypothetical protein